MHEKAKLFCAVCPVWRECRIHPILTGTLGLSGGVLVRGASIVKLDTRQILTFRQALDEVGYQGPVVSRDTYARTSSAHAVDVGPIVAIALRILWL